MDPNLEIPNPNLIEQVNLEKFCQGPPPEQAFFIEYQHAQLSNKLQDLQTLTHNQRKTYVLHLPEIAKLLKQSFIQNIQSYLQFLLTQNDQIKRCFLQQIPQLLLLQLDYNSLLKLIINPLLHMLKQSTLDIKQQAGKHLAKIGHKFSEQDKTSILLKQIIQMAHDKQRDQNRIVAVQLFSKIADIFEQKHCEQYIGLQMLSLSEDSSIRVRKQVVLNLTTISKKVSKQFFKNKLFNVYLKQIKLIRKCEQVNWAIRKVCVDVIIQMCSLCDQNLIKDYIIPTYKIFLNDKHRWVKQNSYKRLGHLIAISKVLNKQLLDIYLKTLDIFYAEQEIIEECSFYLPGVIFKHQDQWKNLLPFFTKLTKHNNKKVRLPLAASLFQISKFLGQQITQKQLLPILQQFLKSQNEEIIIASIKNISVFFRNLPEQRRQNLLDIFIILQKNPRKWRIRYQIAKQFDKLVQLYQPENVFKFIVPIVFKMANDSVAIVRQIAAYNLYYIAVKFKQKNQQVFLGMVLDNIMGFSSSERYFHRLTQVFLISFLRIAEGFIKSNLKQFFLNKLKSQVQNKKDDKVANVRLLAQQVCKLFQ